jgi:tetratricopeptide (TPR) repeat protein
MLAIALVATLTLQSPAPAPATSALEASAARREADLHNLLILRLRSLKRGADAEALKSEIVNEIDFATISPRGLELLKRAMSLYDKAIAGQATLSEKLAGISQAETAAQGKALAGLLTTLSSATPVGMVTALLALDSADSVGSRRTTLLAQNAASLGADISGIEFDLAVLRSQIQAGGGVSASDFVLPADYDLFMAATGNKDDSERAAGVAAALERSPKLQPAALYLALLFGQSGKAAECVRYADRVIECAPTILRRDGLRAQALLCKARVALEAKDYLSTRQFADSGLRDEPGHTALLFYRGTASAFLGDHAAALPDFEKLLILAPKDTHVLYNLACCRCVASKDADGGLVALESALHNGFADIAHAKADADLTLLREQRRSDFERLAAVQLGVGMEWALLDKDVLVIENRSAFPLVKLDLAVTFSGMSPLLNAPPSPWTTERKFTIATLSPGERQRFPALDTTKDSLRSVRVVATGTQGQFEVTKTTAELTLPPKTSK